MEKKKEPKAEHQESYQNTSLPHYSFRNSNMSIPPVQHQIRQQQLPPQQSSSSSSSSGQYYPSHLYGPSTNGYYLQDWQLPFPHNGFPPSNMIHGNYGPQTYIIRNHPPPPPSPMPGYSYYPDQRATYPRQIKQIPPNMIPHYESPLISSQVSAPGKTLPEKKSSTSQVEQQNNSDTKLSVKEEPDQDISSGSSLKRNVSGVDSVDDLEDASKKQTRQQRKQEKKRAVDEEDEEEALNGHKRLSIAFESFGSLTDLPQRIGRKKGYVPDGASGTYSMYGESWRFSVRHAERFLDATGKPRVRVEWAVFNKNSDLAHVVVETKEEAIKREGRGITICNRVFKEALEMRAKEYDREIAMEKQGPNPNTLKLLNLEARMTAVRPVRFSEGPLLFGLRHQVLFDAITKSG